MGVTSIEWTSRTWNPVRGCRLVSPGCTNCYAMKQAGRFSGPGMPYEGLVKRGGKGFVWTGTARLVPEMLAAPLRWKKPQRVFVNSMSDLFHEDLSDDDIDWVLGAMAAAPQHQYQILSKRAARMRAYFAQERHGYITGRALRIYREHHGRDVPPGRFMPWPMPWAWLGVSVENQETADERIPELWDTSACLRFISYEPALGPIDILHWLRNGSINWVIVGSESGPGARPMDIDWARSVVGQCQAAHVPVFVKQIANERDRKGGNPEFWPPGNWPRQFPEVRR